MPAIAPPIPGHRYALVWYAGQRTCHMSGLVTGTHDGVIEMRGDDGQAYAIPARSLRAATREEDSP
jgi:hypothetical protein